MNSLFSSGIRPAIDDYLQKKSEEVRDYGDYWSASSAGYCQRKLILERLGVPQSQDARKIRVFSSGHIFHQWIQEITRGAELSLAQELELQDDDLMVRGHIDDIVDIEGHLILYDYKTAHSRSFTYSKARPEMGHYHRYQLGTYLYMLRQTEEYADIEEARRMSISKDDLRMDEKQLLWDEQLEAEIKLYWGTLNSLWNDKKIPPCSCHLYDGGFMANEKYNPYFYEGEPCSIKLYQRFKEDNAVTET